MGNIRGVGRMGNIIRGGGSTFFCLGREQFLKNNTKKYKKIQKIQRSIKITFFSKKKYEKIRKTLKTTFFLVFCFCLGR